MRLLRIIQGFSAAPGTSEKRLRLFASRSTSPSASAPLAEGTKHRPDKTGYITIPVLSLSHTKNLLIDILQIASCVLIGDRLAGRLPCALVGNLNDVDALALQGVQRLLLDLLRLRTAVVRCDLAGILDNLLLVRCKLVPGLCGDYGLHRAQRVLVECQVRSNFLEAVGQIVRNRLFSAVDRAVLHGRIDFGHGYRRRRSAKILNHGCHDRVIGDADLHVLHVIRRLDFLVLDREEAAEALFAVVQALYTDAQLCRLVKESLAQITVGECPEMIPILESVRQRQKNRLLCAICRQSERGNTGDVNGTRAACHSVEYVRLGAEHTGALQINRDRAAAHRLDRFLELGVHGAADRVVYRVNLSHRQLYSRILGSRIIDLVIRTAGSRLGRGACSCRRGRTCSLRRSACRSTRRAAGTCRTGGP